jgi:chemotaxis protein MotB
MAHPEQKLYDSDPTEDTSWLLTYADIITLLLIFFVLLFSSSKINKEKFDAVALSINQSMNQPAPFILAPQPELEPEPEPEPVIEPEPEPVNLLELAQLKLDDLIKKEGLESKVQSNLTEVGLMIELSSNSFFDSGSAEIRTSMQSSLRGLSQVILSLPLQTYKVEIEGHTDNAPINTGQFPSNWELAALRSINVLHLFNNSGIPKQKLSVSAFADTRPKFPNIGLNGQPIPANQAKNRRVVVHILNITTDEIIEDELQ